MVEGGALYTTDEDEIQEEYKVWKKNTPFLCKQHRQRTDEQGWDEDEDGDGDEDGA